MKAHEKAVFKARSGLLHYEQRYLRQKYRCFNVNESYCSFNGVNFSYTHSGCLSTESLDRIPIGPSKNRTEQSPDHCSESEFRFRLCSWYHIVGDILDADVKVRMLLTLCWWQNMNVDDWVKSVTYIEKLTMLTLTVSRSRLSPKFFGLFSSRCVSMNKICILNENEYVPVILGKPNGPVWHFWSSRLVFWLVKI